MSGPSDMDPGEAQLHEQVKVLGEKFLIRTAGQIATLREHVARLRGGDPDALARVQELAHKIHGSGAMFGFAELSEAAGEIERHTMAAAGSEASDRLDTLIDQLAVALERTRQGPDRANG
jgi:HPt (histidine-containing phosphotransfer) domain-containing protein